MPDTMRPDCGMPEVIFVAHHGYGVCVCVCAGGQAGERAGRQAGRRAGGRACMCVVTLPLLTVAITI